MKIKITYRAEDEARAAHVRGTPAAGAAKSQGA